MEKDLETGSGPGWLQRVVIGRNPKRTALRIVVLSITCFVLFRYVLLPIRVEGVSMMVTQRSEFASIVQRNGGQVRGLLAMMREKTASVAAR